MKESATCFGENLHPALRMHCDRTWANMGVERRRGLKSQSFYSWIARFNARDHIITAGVLMQPKSGAITFFSFELPELSDRKRLTANLQKPQSTKRVSLTGRAR